jgi:hypothetical protein
MARRLVVTDRYSSAWENSFSFWPDTEIMPEVTAMKAMGVHKVNMRIGCTSPSEFFTDLVEVVAEKGVAVDVLWLKAVRDLCESMTPAIIGELRRVTVPDEDDLDGHLQGEVAMGNYLLDVSVHWNGDEASASADFYLSAVDAGAGSAGAKKALERLRPRRSGYLMPVAASEVSTATQ